MTKTVSWYQTYMFTWFIVASFLQATSTCTKSTLFLKYVRNRVYLVSSSSACTDGCNPKFHMNGAFLLYFFFIFENKEGWRREGGGVIIAQQVQNNHEALSDFCILAIRLHRKRYCNSRTRYCNSRSLVFA